MAMDLAIVMVLVVALMLAMPPGDASAQHEGVVAEGAAPELVRDGFMFTEGPARAADGSVYFSDVRAGETWHWTPEGELAIFREDTGGGNGMYFDAEGNLFVCEGDRGRITRVTRGGEVSVVADEYDGARFNRPNDLWVARDGGVYFSDPNYGGGELSQDGEHVYYVPPGGGEVVRIIDDMVRPNGLIGTADGRTLYITDAGGGNTWRFAVGEDGSLSGRTLFVEFGGDGMTIDAEGNVYLALDAVMAFNAEGEPIDRIELPERPTNMCFAGEELRTLFITARGSVFTVEMRVCGAAR